MANLDAFFGRPFPEQVAALRLRFESLVGTSRWDDLIGNQHDRAFMVAGATKADLLSDLAAAVDKAVSQGGTYDLFKKDFRDIVERRGWHGWTGEGTTAGEDWRMKVIYKTNMSVSYHAGRLAQLREGGFKYWVYRHGGSEEPRLHHLALDGLILEADHPFWSVWFPPNDWGCSCYVVGARSREHARLVGGDPSVALPANWSSLDPKTGAPLGIGKGWDYQPGAGSEADVRSIAAKPVNWTYDVARAFFDSLTIDKAEAISASMRSLRSTREAVEKVARTSIADPNLNSSISLGLLPRWMRKSLSGELGADAGGFDLHLRSSSIRHAMNRHGDSDREVSRGQIPITPADFGAIVALLDGQVVLRRVGDVRGRPRFELVVPAERFTYTLILEQMARYRALQFVTAWKS